MLADFVESLFSPVTVLWLFASFVAASIVFGTLHRRRVRLTDSLKTYVERSQNGPVKSKSADKNDTTEPN